MENDCDTEMVRLNKPFLKLIPWLLLALIGQTASWMRSLRCMPQTGEYVGVPLGVGRVGLVIHAGFK